MVLVPTDAQSSNLQGSKQIFLGDSVAFCFSYWSLLSSLGQDGPAKSAFCIISNPRTRKIGRTRKNCHLFMVTGFWELPDFKLMLVLNFKWQRFNSD